MSIMSHNIDTKYRIIPSISNLYYKMNFSGEIHTSQTYSGTLHLQTIRLKEEKYV